MRSHLGAALLTLLLALTSAAVSLTVDFLRAGPVLDRGKLSLRQSIRITDRNGGTLYQFSSGEERQFLQADELTSTVKNATLAIEDERFFSRTLCVDGKALLRALRVNVTEERTEGASTITQQLTRMLYLSPEKTISRKLYEIILSCRLEMIVSKDDILTLYLNAVSYGNGINGIEQAAETYFGVPASGLSTAQAAVLAAIPQRPSYFSPYGPHAHSAITGETLRALRRGTLRSDGLTANTVITGVLPKTYRGKNGPVRINGRADAVLRSMLRLRFITDAEFAAATKELSHMTFRPLAHPIVAPHFALQARHDMESLLETVAQPGHWEALGLTVRTTLDPAMQFAAESVIARSQTLLSQARAKNVALVALDRHTRQVVAYVGNNDFFADANDGQVDMARAPRQPGSSFKPLVYATAFERGFSPDTIVRDEPIRIGTDVPKNYEGGFKGPMTVRAALAQSRNIPAIKTFIDIGGEDVVLPVGAAAGVTTPSTYKEEMRRSYPGFSYGWPMAIGAVEVPLIEMVQLYATIANHGQFLPLQTLCSVTDRRGDAVFDIPRPQPVQAIQAQAADGVSGILEDSGSRPEGFWRSMLTIPGLRTAAKTGTSNVCFRRDVFGRCTEYGVNNVWTMGYTDDLVVGVWVGNADNTTMDPLADGLTVAAPIWRTFLQEASPLYDGERVRCE